MRSANSLSKKETKTQTYQHQILTFKTLELANVWQCCLTERIRQIIKTVLIFFKSANHCSSLLFCMVNIISEKKFLHLSKKLKNWFSHCSLKGRFFFFFLLIILKKLFRILILMFTLSRPKKNSSSPTCCNLFLCMQKHADLQRRYRMRGGYFCVDDWVFFLFLFFFLHLYWQAGVSLGWTPRPRLA